MRRDSFGILVKGGAKCPDGEWIGEMRQQQRVRDTELVSSRDSCHVAEAEQKREEEGMRKLRAARDRRAPFLSYSFSLSHPYSRGRKAGVAMFSRRDINESRPNNTS